MLLNKNSREDGAFKYIKKEVDNLIKEKRNLFIKKYAKKFLKTVEEKEAFPIGKLAKLSFDMSKKTIYVANMEIKQLKTIIKGINK